MTYSTTRRIFRHQQRMCEHSQSVRRPECDLAGCVEFPSHQGNWRVILQATNVPLALD